MFKVVPITERPVHNQTMVNQQSHLHYFSLKRQQTSVLTGCPSQMYVRAMTDYSPQQDPTIPCADAGMSFRKGDILEIVDQTDALWWQAKKLPSSSACAGLIPSTNLLKRSDPEPFNSPFCTNSIKNGLFSNRGTNLICSGMLPPCGRKWYFHGEWL